MIFSCHSIMILIVVTDPHSDYLHSLLYRQWQAKKQSRWSPGRDDDKEERRERSAVTRKEDENHVSAT